MGLFPTKPAALGMWFPEAVGTQHRRALKLRSCFRKTYHTISGQGFRLNDLSWMSYLWPGHMGQPPGDPVVSVESVRDLWSFCVPILFFPVSRAWGEGWVLGAWSLCSACLSVLSLVSRLFLV